MDLQSSLEFESIDGDTYLLKFTTSLLPGGTWIPTDVLVTRETRTSGEMMDIELLDHVIIGSNGYVSMKEKSLGFN